jgi:hypothetical protein
LGELEPAMRGFGALILGFGGLTSLYGFLTKSWERVDYIVRGEMTYLALSTLVFFISALLGRGPALSNQVFAAVSVVLLILFTVTWFTRPR